jgi:hypothetical protein
MIPQVTLRAALADKQLLGSVLSGDTWHAWRSILLAAMGEPLMPNELDTFRSLTGRYAPPTQRVEELEAVVGRRGGKSSAIASLAVYIAGLCDHKDRLAPGERGVVMCIAPDQKQSRIVLDYCTGVLESTPILAQLIANRTADTLELTTGAAIETRAASFRRLRGVTCLAVIADEAAFWLADESSSNPDTEILKAVRPSLATTRGLLAIISSPYARKGEVWEIYRRHFGPDGDPAILVAQGTSRDFNPSLPQTVIDRAMERDAAGAAAEYLAQFRTDIEGFVTIEAVRACVPAGVRERLPDKKLRYSGFVDPSGGSADSMTLAVGHREGTTAILDAVREVKPPFSPEATVSEFAELLKRYRCSRVVGDRYGGEWPREAFRKCGIHYEPSEKTRSELYLDFLPMLNSRACELLDNDRLVNQFVNLERRTARSGKDTIDHGGGLHDDLANSVAGVMVTADAPVSNFNRKLEYADLGIV